MADKFIYLDRIQGRLKEKSAIDVSNGASDAGKLIALGEDGRIHRSMIYEDVGVSNISLPAYEALIAGDFVNIFLDSGVPKVRKADASANKPAHGYVLSSVASGSTAIVYFDHQNTKLTGLTVGAYYFLSNTTAGTVMTACPTTTGHIMQIVGVAISPTTIDVEIEQPIEVG